MSVAERREREREQRRNRILDAAQRAFYAKGYELTTVEDVADEAQLGKGTLYLYFRTKEDLLLGVAIRHQRRIIERFEEEARAASDGLELVRRLLGAYAEHMTTPLEHLKMVMSRWVQAAPLDQGLPNACIMRDNAMRIFGLMRGAVERGQSDGSIRPDLEPGPLYLKLWSAVNGALLLQLQMRCLSHPNPVIDPVPPLPDTIALLLDAIRASRGPALRSVRSLPDEEAREA